MSASTAPSYMTDGMITTRAFCVVCGKMNGDLELRGSGLKCKGCVGKRSNKHWVKLQKRQATQLLSEVSAPSSTLRPMSSSSNNNSPPPSTLDLMTPMSDNFSSSSHPRRGKSEVIADYITGTSVFQKAMHRTRHSDANSDIKSPLSASQSPSGLGKSTASPPPPRSAPPAHGSRRVTSATAEEYSVSSECSTPSSQRVPSTPPAGGPPRRLGSSKTNTSLPGSATNGPSLSVIHSSDIHVPHSRPSVTSITPKVTTPQATTPHGATPSNRDAEGQRSGSGTTTTTSVAEPPKAPAVAAAETATTGSPDAVTLPTNKTTTTTTTATTSVSPRDARLPQRASPGCVVSLAEPGRGTPTTGNHQRVMSYSMHQQDAPVHHERDGSSVGEHPLEAPIDHSRCPSTVSGVGGPTRLPSRSPTAPTGKSPSKPTRQTAPEVVVASSPSSPASDEEDGEEEGSATSNSSSYITSESAAAASNAGDASRAARRELRSQTGEPAADDADDTNASAPPPLTLNLDRLDLAVLYVTPAQLAAETSAASPRPTANSGDEKRSSSRAGSTAQSLTGSVCSTASSSSSTQQRRSQVTVKGAFTVTRPLPNKELHARTRSTDLANGKGLASSSAAAAAAPNGQVEVRRLQFRLSVLDRDGGSELFHVDRGFFKEIMPALEAVRKVTSSSSGCPPLPSKTLPSFRYATDAYIEERRQETSNMTRFIIKDAFLVRHPAIVKLLELDPALHAAPHAPAQSSSPQDAAGARGKSRGGSTGDGDKAKSGAAAAPYLDSHSLDPLRTAGKAGGGRRSSASSRASGHSSSRSSVVRRSRLDCVTTEDLEKVQLGTVIGRGSFGTVCQGYLQTASGPVVVAVKRVHVDPHVTEGGQDTLGEAQSELDILRKAKHKNVVRFLGSIFSPTAMELSVFTEYVECGTLASMVERFGCLPLLAIQKYMKQILEGLRHLHQLSIVHRDIKGENVLVTKNGRVKLTDFGSSGVLNEVGAASVMPMGSPLWMAPEILRGDIAEAPGDIWAVGCVGIEMLNRSIWTVTANDAVNPFVFMYRISKLGTPPQGLPTAEEVDGFKARGEQEAYDSFSVYRDFLVQCLQMNPADRWTADQLLQHPFIHTPFSRFIRWQSPEGEEGEKSKDKGTDATPKP